MTSQNILSRQSISIVLPSKNEADNLKLLLPKLLKVTENTQTEIIVVDDGSTDDTKGICERFGITVVSHPYSMGNGAAIKSGTRSAKGDLIVFMDADGQHDPQDIPKLVAKLHEGFELVVGSRESNTHASFARKCGNHAYNKLASIMTGHTIKDLTSGFRATRARHFIKFLYLLPNGFSYPTTSTMAFFRSGLPVAYVPIKAARRQGHSKISLTKDGVRFFLIIIKIGALFSPMRFFLPISATIFFLGLSYYAFTYFAFGRFTNMSALLFTTAILSFLIGIISEQVSALHYKGADEDARRIEREH